MPQEHTVVHQAYVTHIRTLSAVCGRSYRRLNNAQGRPQADVTQKP
jgi:hypothetical protein